MRAHFLEHETDVGDFTGDGRSRHHHRTHQHRASIRLPDVPLKLRFDEDAEI